MLKPMREREDPASNYMRDESQFDDLCTVWESAQMQAESTTYQATTSGAIQQRGDQVKQPGAVISSQVR